MLRTSRQSNYWGLVQQRGPWDETPIDKQRLHNTKIINIGGGVSDGGTLHAGHSQWNTQITPSTYPDILPPIPNPSTYAQISNLIPGPPQIPPRPGKLPKYVFKNPNTEKQGTFHPRLIVDINIGESLPLDEDESFFDDHEQALYAAMARRDLVTGPLGHSYDPEDEPDMYYEGYNNSLANAATQTDGLAINAQMEPPSIREPRTSYNQTSRINPVPRLSYSQIVTNSITPNERDRTVQLPSGETLTVPSIQQAARRVMYTRSSQTNTQNAQIDSSSQTFNPTSVSSTQTDTQTNTQDTPMSADTSTQTTNPTTVSTGTYPPDPDFISDVHYQIVTLNQMLQDQMREYLYNQESEQAAFQERTFVQALGSIEQFLHLLEIDTTEIRTAIIQARAGGIPPEQFAYVVNELISAQFNQIYQRMPPLPTGLEITNIVGLPNETGNPDPASTTRRLITTPHTVQEISKQMSAGHRYIPDNHVITAPIHGRLTNGSSTLGHQLINSVGGVPSSLDRLAEAASLNPGVWTRPGGSVNIGERLASMSGIQRPPPQAQPITPQKRRASTDLESGQQTQRPRTGRAPRRPQKIQPSTRTTRLQLKKQEQGTPSQNTRSKKVKFDKLK